MNMKVQGESRFKRPVALLVAFLLLTFAVAGCGGDDDGDAAPPAETTTAAEEGTEAEAGELEDVTVLLSFPRGFVWTPLLVAEDQGYFEDEGLNVTVEETNGASFVTQQLVAGNADFGWAGAAADVIAYSTADNIRALACNTARNIFTINATEASGIQSVEELDGKKIGIREIGAGEEPLVRSLIEEYDLDAEVIPLGDMGPAVLRALESGQVDAMAGGVTDLATLRAGGAELNDITPDDYDAMPGDCFVTTSEAMADDDKKETAAKIIRAWMKGAYFAIANPEAAIDVGCKVVPESCSDMETFTIPFVDRVLEIITPLDPNVPPTTIDVAGWEQTAKVLHDAETIDEEVDVTNLAAGPETQAVAELAYADVEAAKAEAEADAAAYEVS